jgi:hypothetical protein
MLAAGLSISVILLVFLFSQSDQFKSLQSQLNTLFLAVQNFSIEASRIPENMRAPAAGDFKNQTSQSGKSPLPFLSAAKMDNARQSIYLNQKEKYINGVNWMPEYRPFVIQLGSVKTFKQVIRAVTSYAMKDLDIHWDWVNLGKKGKWYRIFAGHFESKAAAQKARRDYGLKKSSIRFNPWTILIGQYSDDKILASIRSLLHENHFDSLIVQGAEEINWLLTGAFATRQGAEKMAKKLHKLNLSTQVVPR